MTKITGTGCTVSGLIGAYIGASPKSILEDTALIIDSMGLCGELAKKRLKKRLRHWFF